MNRKFMLTLLLALPCWLPPLAVSQEADPFKACARCHGADGNSTKAPTPSISGLAAEYIIASLEAYKNGSRACGFSRIKCKMAVKWSDDQIRQAASHYAGLARSPADQPFDAARVERGKALHQAHCAQCHADSGAAGAGGLLQGQWREYLDYAMGQYRDGARAQPAAMQAAVESLGEGDWDALLHYYASGS